MIFTKKKGVQLNTLDLSAGGNLDGNPSSVRFRLAVFRSKIAIARRNQAVFSRLQVRKSEASIGACCRCVRLK